MGMQGTPCWFELDTTDLDASTAFYGQILGWQVADSGMPDADYRLASAPDGAMVAGLSSTDEQEQASPKWVVYFAVDDADATAGDVADRGGQTIVEPTDIPGTGRFAILTDPQGVAFGVLQPLPMEDGSQGGRAFDMEAPGHGGWIELMTTDPAAGCDFYADEFGWTKGESMDMGDMGTYQLFAHNGDDIGGMMGLGDAPVPAWLPYFTVANGVTASAEAITAAGGSVHHGPAEVPGGGHIAVCQDPQGAWFAILGTE